MPRNVPATHSAVTIAPAMYGWPVHHTPSAVPEKSAAPNARVSGR